MNTNITACPLDCFDACSIIYDGKKLTGVKEGHTQGFLCPHLNHYESFERITKPRYKGQEISMDEALAKELSAVSKLLGVSQREIVEKALDFYFDYLDVAIAEKISKDIEEGRMKVYEAEEVLRS